MLARHPLDVLVSWLNLVYYKHADGVCPGGGACTECGIVGAAPRSEAFVEYVRGYYGRVLLCHSPAWWDRPGVLRARYEDLVAAPEPALGRLAGRLGEDPVRPLGEVVAAHTLREMRANPEVWRFHCWQGQPGLWRQLIPAAEARAMRAGVPEPFDVLGYPCEPDEALTAAGADYYWARVQLDSTRDHLAREREKQIRAAREATALRDALAITREALREERWSHAETRRALDRARTPEVPPVPGRLLRLTGLSRRVRPGRDVAAHPARPTVPVPHFATGRPDPDPARADADGRNRPAPAAPLSV